MIAIVDDLEENASHLLRPVKASHILSSSGGGEALQTETPMSTNLHPRIAALPAVEALKPARIETLAAAVEAGVSDTGLEKLATAWGTSKRHEITLPFGAHETGRGKGRGWARMGTGSDALWGVDAERGFKVGPGEWTVGSTDGGAKSSRDRWLVEEVTVGAERWLVSRKLS